MEKLSNRIWDDLMNTLVGLSGSLKDIACGTRIRIPMDAGFVTYSKSSDGSETLSMYIKEMMIPETQKEVDLEDNYT